MTTIMAFLKSPGVSIHSASVEYGNNAITRFEYYFANKGRSNRGWNYTPLWTKVYDIQALWVRLWAKVIHHVEKESDLTQKTLKLDLYDKTTYK